MGENRRVVITGMGLVSPIGNSVDEFWQSLCAGKSGIGPLTQVPVDAVPFSYAGEATGFTGDIENFGPLEKTKMRAIKKGQRVMCREIEMGVAASQLALNHAGLDENPYSPEESGILFGSDYIMTQPDEYSDGIRNCTDADGEFHYSQWGDKGISKIPPLWLLKYLPNMPASHIAIYNDFRGPNNSLTLREASSNLALGEAADTISRGHAEVMIVGATGTRVHPVRTMHVMTQEEVAPDTDPPSEMSRPFDKTRAGMVLGEGAAAVILETAESAEKRGATIYGEVIGHGSSIVQDKNRIANCRKAIFNATQRALKQSGVAASRIGHIQAHGLSTQSMDIQEAAGLRDVFGDDIPPVTAAKSYFGNLGAASGMVELIGGLLCLEHDQLFRTLNYRQPDPECLLPIVTETMAAGTSLLNVNTTPQGQASVSIVRRYA